jgi:hypothetical protein
MKAFPRHSLRPTRRPSQKQATPSQIDDISRAPSVLYDTNPGSGGLLAQRRRSTFTPQVIGSDMTTF